jgi:hypothetical protein
MLRLSLMVVALFFVGLSVLAAETKPADSKPVTGTAEAKVDKTLDKYKNKEPRIWAEVDYFGLSGSDGKGPGYPVLTTMPWGVSSHRGGFVATGELDIPGVKIAYNPKAEDFGWSNGFKGALGGWLDDAREWGAELNGFLSPGASDRHAASTASLPANTYLGVPYYNVFTHDEDSAALGLTAAPDQVGTAGFSFSRGDFWGIGARGLKNLARQERLSLDASFGFRNLNLSEKYQATYSQLNASGAGVRLCGFLSGSGAVPGYATAQDRVEARDHFYGADLGVRFSYHLDRFILDVDPRIALGAMDEALKTSGSCRVWNGATNATLFAANGGFFARPNVVGERSKTAFAVIPNVSVKVGVRITEHLQFKVGYEFLYISDVVYAGNQLDRRISLPRAFGGLTGVPASGVSKPFRTDDFMAHGVTAGFTIKF